MSFYSSTFTTAPYQLWHNEVTTRVTEQTVVAASVSWRRGFTEEIMLQARWLWTQSSMCSLQTKLPNVFFFFFGHFCHCTIDVRYLLYDKCYVPLCSCLPSPRSLSAARPTQPRLNGWAVLWKTAAVLIYKPPSLCSHLCLQGSALDILNSEWGISKHTMAESATEPSIKGHSIVLCVLSDKLCLDSCKQLKALKAFTYYAAFEWSFWNVPL